MGNGDVVVVGRGVSPFVTFGGRGLLNIDFKLIKDEETIVIIVFKDFICKITPIKYTLIAS